MKSLRQLVEEYQHQGRLSGADMYLLMKLIGDYGVCKYFSKNVLIDNGDILQEYWIGVFGAINRRYNDKERKFLGCDTKREHTIAPYLRIHGELKVKRYMRSQFSKGLVGQCVKCGALHSFFRINDGVCDRITIIDKKKKIKRRCDGTLQAVMKNVDVHLFKEGDVDVEEVFFQSEDFVDKMHAKLDRVYNAIHDRKVINIFKKEVKRLDKENKCVIDRSKCKCTTYKVFITLLYIENHKLYEKLPNFNYIKYLSAKYNVTQMAISLKINKLRDVYWKLKEQNIKLSS